MAAMCPQATMEMAATTGSDSCASRDLGDGSLRPNVPPLKPALELRGEPVPARGHPIYRPRLHKGDGSVRYQNLFRRGG